MGSLTAITGRTVYLDANALIYAVEDAAGLGARMRAVFARIDRGELRGVTSELSWPKSWLSRCGKVRLGSHRNTRSW
jgi:hypothetical protein